MFKLSYFTEEMSRRLLLVRWLASVDNRFGSNLVDNVAGERVDASGDAGEGVSAEVVVSHADDDANLIDELLTSDAEEEDEKQKQWFEEMLKKRMKVWEAKREADWNLVMREREIAGMKKKENFELLGRRECNELFNTYATAIVVKTTDEEKLRMCPITNWLVDDIVCIEQDCLDDQEIVYEQWSVNDCFLKVMMMEIKVW